MSYLLFLRNYKNMFSVKYLLNFFKSIFIIALSYNLPVFIFENVINISDIDLINNICYYIYNIFYKIPAFLFLYTYIGHKVTKQLNILTNKETINPSHIYVFFLINMSYFFFTIIGQTYKIGYFLLPITDTLTYSLYFSEFAYPYIDNNKYRYNNFIDFFNNNLKYFVIFALIYIVLDYNYIPTKFYLLGLFIYTISISPILISINYKKYDPKCIKYYNIFYPFETILSFMVSLTSLILLDKLTKRNIQIK